MSIRSKVTMYVHIVSFLQEHR